MKLVEKLVMMNGYEKEKKREGNIKEHLLEEQNTLVSGVCGASQ